MRSYGDNYGVLRINERSPLLTSRREQLFNGLKLRDWLARHEEAKWRAMIQQRRDPNTRDAWPYCLRKWG